MGGMKWEKRWKEGIELLLFFYIKWGGEVIKQYYGKKDVYVNLKL